uniref:Putative flavocytochrome n=1 Tax=uncultured Aquificaceae bacterium TaxID=374108 RepID=L0MYH4_9AQUI|nr:putative flavocytochrome [uncultured Aquificaceae bacterium]
MKKMYLFGLCMGLVVFSSPIYAVESAKVIAATCFGCHGPDGKTTNKKGYSIVGKPASVIEKTLLQYKEDKLKGTVMNRIAKGYTDEEIKKVAEYLASLK